MADSKFKVGDKVNVRSFITVGEIVDVIENDGKFVYEVYVSNLHKKFYKEKQLQELDKCQRSL